MIAKKSFLVLLNNFVGAFLGLVALKLFALYLGKEPIGEVEYALGLLGILVFITDLGLNSAHVKRVSEGMDEADCFVTFAAFKVVSTGLFVAVVGGVLYVRTAVIGRPIEDTSALVLLLMAGYFVLTSLRLMFVSTFDARRETARREATLLADTAVRVLASIVIALVYAALVHDAGPLAGVLDEPTQGLAWIVENPAAAIASTYLVAGIAGFGVAAIQAWGTIGRGRFRGSILRSYWGFALPMFVASAVGTISGYVDRTALGYFGGVEDVGAFGPLRRVVRVMEAFPSAVVVLLFPTMSALSSQENREAIIRTLRQALRYTAMVLLPSLAYIAAFAPGLIRIGLSAEWVPYWETLSVLAVYVLFLGLTFPYMSMMMGTDRVGTAARIGIVMSVVNVVLNLVLIPDDIQSLGIPLAGLGALGAAIATAISGLVGFVLYRRATNRLLGTSTLGFGLFRQFAASLGMVALLLFIDATLFPGPLRWYQVGVHVVLGGLAYLGLLVLVREFTREDLNFFLGVIHPGELLAYVRDELLGSRETVSKTPGSTSGSAKDAEDRGG